MSVTIPDDILESAGISPEGLTLDIAVLPFQRGARARSGQRVSRIRFQQELARRGVAVHYDT